MTSAYWPRSVWNAPITDARLKKRIVRTVTEEVVADIDAEAADIVLLVHWVGDVHSEMRLPRCGMDGVPVRRLMADVIASVRHLVLIGT